MGLKDAPQLPAETAYLWEIYINITKGVDRLSYMDIEAYQSVSGIRLTPWEVETIFSIDNKKQ